MNKKMTRKEAISYFKTLTGELGLDSYIVLSAATRGKTISELLDRPSVELGTEYAAVVGLVKIFGIKKKDLKDSTESDGHCGQRRYVS